ncbi:transcriptional regulator, MerR family [Kribbella flavida DSM 17836]|uniref:Transcriptional regulator, MerR family n=1 Tax=Kribbella flavida (strain DSM 17836 / JCM 10339 / NBRC 14399) TaxID=479435 RepID=D2PWW8_KRIFD|nr:MerR family transcriptional regulator [Kribbella flavida]ADB35348.1 transcriptional regulator, MerR family [Kribbella flavida DSM 17836]
MHIGELSRRTGVSGRLLRYYEEQGLLEPARTSSGYRVYAEDDVQRVRHIRVLLGAGLGTVTIAELLPCMTTNDDQLVPTCPELVPQFERERDRISDTIANLERARTALGDLIATALPPGVYQAS